MADRKDSDGKRAYVNIQTNNDSIANPEKNDKWSKRKSRDCYRRPIFSSKETKYALRWNEFVRHILWGLRRF